MIEKLLDSVYNNVIAIFFIVLKTGLDGVWMIFFWIGHFIRHIPDVLKLISAQLIVMLVMIFFHYINKKFPSYRRFGFIAFGLSVVFPGGGFAYARAYVRAWLTYGIMMINYYFIAMYPMTGNTAAPFFIVMIIQLIWSTIYASPLIGRFCFNQNKYEENLIETRYLEGLQSYIKQGYQVAVDTNFLMHLFVVLESLFRETNAHLYLHPTVFGELEGLKGNKRHEVRMLAQRGFDVLEMYQKEGRMQWTRKQRAGQNFSQADQRIVTGVSAEMQAGTKLVFASHDKGARILARSLNISVVDPIDSLNKNKKISS